MKILSPAISLASLLMLLLCQSVSAQFLERPRYSRDSIIHLTKENLLEDIDVYRHGVARNHVAPFTIVSRKDFYARLDSVKANAAQYDVDQLFAELLKVNALIQDEHTNILFSLRDGFPFRCYWFSEGVYITATDQDNIKYLFSRIIAVNGIPIEQVAARIATIIPDTNRASLMDELTYMLFDPFILHGLQLSPARNKVTYTLLTPRHDTVTITPAATDKRTTHLLKGFSNTSYLRTSKPGRYWFKYIDTGNYIYFKYASCFGDNKNPFEKTEQAMMKEIAARRPAKIIIDLRDNGGGYPRLLSGFIDDIARSDLNRKGGIYVLIGRKTFSAAILNAVWLKNRTYATLVGEKAAGSVVHFGGVDYFDLPATGLKVMYSTQHVITSENYEGSLRPDIEVPDSFTDYTQGTDGPLQYAISH